MHYTTQIIFNLAIILFATNIIRALSTRYKVPPVIGLLLIGFVFGPSLFNIIKLDVTISWIAQVGVLFLIFSAGVQTNLKRLKDDSRQASLPSVGAIVFPFACGYLLTFLFTYSFVSSLVTGTIFAAASISIPLMTLIEIDRFKSTEGRCIVNVAIINDIVSIVLISVLMSVSINEGSIYYVALLPLLQIAFFFFVTFVIGKFILLNIYANSKRLNLENSLLSFSIALILLYAWFAELLGLEAIMGALICGFFIGQTSARHSIDSGITQLGKSFFVDVFFVSIGLGVNLRELSFNPLFLALFIMIAMISKFAGSFTGALLTRFDVTRSLRIGVGLIPRGEVSLIISAAAFNRGLISMEIQSMAILLVVISSIIAPFLIKLSYTSTKKETF